MAPGEFRTFYPFFFGEGAGGFFDTTPDFTAPDRATFATLAAFGTPSCGVGIETGCAGFAGLVLAVLLGAAADLDFCEPPAIPG
jgi:hypothetical protein